MLYGPHINALERLRSGGPWSAQILSVTGIGTMSREEGWAARALLLPPLLQWGRGAPGVLILYTDLRLATEEVSSLHVVFVVKVFLSRDRQELGSTGGLLRGGRNSWHPPWVVVAGGGRNSQCGLCPSPCQLFHFYLHLSACLTGTHSGYSMAPFRRFWGSSQLRWGEFHAVWLQVQGDRLLPLHELRRSRGRGHCTVSPRPTLSVCSLWSALAVRRTCSSAAESAFVGALLLGCG